MLSVLVASGDQSAVAAIGQALGGRFHIERAASRDTCLEKFRAQRYEFTFIDTAMLQGEAVPAGRNNLTALLQPFREVFPNAPLIVLARQERIREAVELVKAGADNYLAYPIDPQEVSYVINSLEEIRQIESELHHLRDQFWREDLRGLVRTNSLAMRAALDKIQSVAPTKTTVLLTGETGTGKSLMAKLIHSHSIRRQGPFISVHCGSIPETLVESELFGHEKGAFTGAVKRKLGKFQVAHGGTIFLDEVGTMPPGVQIKLLEVLQENVITRVGGEHPLEVDVRVVAASNADLKNLTDQGLFRKDLYYRLNVFPVELPPLRQRSEDLPILIETLLARLNRINGKGVKRVRPEVLGAFMNYDWPGNIRELENLLERAYILSNSPELAPEHFPIDMFMIEASVHQATSAGLPPLADVRKRAVEEAERRYLSEMLSLHQGHIEKTADAAGVTSRQLFNLMQKHGLRKEDFRPVK